MAGSARLRQNDITICALRPILWKVSNILHSGFCCHHPNQDKQNSTQAICAASVCNSSFLEVVWGFEFLCFVAIILILQWGVLVLAVTRCHHEDQMLMALDIFP